MIVADELQRMKNLSAEAMQALAEYVKAFDKCAKEPDETYGAAFIETNPTRERLEQLFTQAEIDAIVCNLDEIRDALHKAELLEP